MGVTVSDLVTAYGANYINHGQNQQRLLKKMNIRGKTAELAQRRVIDDTVYRLGNADMSRIVQPFQKQFTELGELTIKPQEIKLYNIKADIAVWPDDIVSSWVGFLADKDDNERKNWPLIRYIMEEHMAPKIPDDLERNEYFKGEYAAPTAGTAGSVGTAMDGIKKLVDDGISSGTMNQILLSATPTSANAFDIVEEFVDGIDDEYKSEPMVLLMAEKHRVNYFRDKRNTHGADNNYTDGKAMTIDGYPSITIEGLQSMAGSDYIIATTRTNYLHIKRSNGMKVPELQADGRQVKILTDWWEGLGFGINELVWAYDGTNVS